LRHEPSGIGTAVLGLLGAAIFIGVWEAGHYLTPEEGRKFLPSVEQVMYALLNLFREQDFLDDVIASCIRIFLSFFAAAAVSIPLGVLMGCFSNLRALLNPTLSGWRYLPAASFMPLLLVWFGPTDTAKLALLFIGVVFFLTALILDNTEAVPNEFVEAALTMGASRREVVLNVVVPAAAPAIFDSMRNMIAVGWTYLVIAEIVGADSGIGAMMMRAGRTLSVDEIMAGILTIGVLGVMTDILFRIVARLLLPWATSR
jgi:NitT/TauT family transport system permease protein